MVVPGVKLVEIRVWMRLSKESGMRAKDLGQNFGRDPQLVKRTGVSEAES